MNNHIPTLVLSTLLLLACSDAPGVSEGDDSAPIIEMNEVSSSAQDLPPAQEAPPVEDVPPVEDAPATEPTPPPVQACWPGQVSLLADLGPYAREPYFNVHVVDDIAYVSSGLGLELFDVSDPTTPTPLSWLETTATFFVTDVRVVDGIAYIANRLDGLWIVDVSDPTAPFELSAHDFGITWDVEVDGDLAWFATGTRGLVAYDISDPTHPVEFSQVDSGWYALAVALSDDHAYVTYENLHDQDDPGKGGLHIIDISDPADPVEVAAYGLATTVLDVQVRDGLAYIASEVGFEVLDVSDPANPQLVGSLDMPSSIVELDGDLAWVRTWTPDLVAVDISDPAAMTVVGTAWDAQAYGLTVVGDTLFIAGGPKGLQVVDVADPSAAQVLGSYEGAMGIAKDLAFDGDRVWVATHSGSLSSGSRLHGYDVSDPTAPHHLGSGAHAGKFGHLTLSEGVAYATTNDTITAWDITGDADPVLLGAETIGHNHDRLRGSTVWEGLLYVVKRHGLVILDADTLAEVGRLDEFHSKRIFSPDHAPVDAYVDGDSPPQFVGDLAFIGTAAGIVVVDVSDPTTPVQLNTPVTVDHVTSPYVSRFVWLDGQTLLSARGDIFDVSNVHEPVLLSETGVTWSALLSAEGRLFTADTVLQVFPVSPEASDQPPEAAAVSAPWQMPAEAISVHGDLVATAGGHVPLRIHRVGCAPEE